MIVPACKERPKITKWIVPCITRFSTNFDRLSKTHIVEELYGTLPLPDVDGVDGVWWELRRAYFDSSTSAERKQVADQTLFLIRTMQLNPLLKQMMEVRKYTVGMVLDFFIKSGFLVDGSVWGGRNLAEKKPLSEADHTLLREKLFSALSFLISDPDIVWASYAVQKLHDSRVLEKGVVKLDKHVQKIWNEGYTTMDNLRRVLPLVRLDEAYSSVVKKERKDNLAIWKCYLRYVYYKYVMEMQKQLPCWRNYNDLMR